MPAEISLERLEGLLVDPREDLDCEIKGWLDLQGSNDHKAVLAKAAIALANHGGGYVILGLREADTGGFEEAPGRPVNLERYSQDAVNGIVSRYCNPAFQCPVRVTQATGGPLSGRTFPIVRIPSGHRVPVMAKRGAPEGGSCSMRTNDIFIRRPGPSSETPQNPQDWEALLHRCLLNQRDDLLNAFRHIIEGPQTDDPSLNPNRQLIRAAPSQVSPPFPNFYGDGSMEASEGELDGWIETSFRRWQELVSDMPETDGPRFSHGHYCLSYRILGDRKTIRDGELPALLQRSVVRHTGWPPFWYPTREGIAPYLLDGVVECWLGCDPTEPSRDRTPGDSDFWRIAKNGMAFLLRGYQEDSGILDWSEEHVIDPGMAFDITLPVWRVGETLLHARNLAANLFEGPTAIRFAAIYSGLSGRSLVSVNRHREVPIDEHVARQDRIELPLAHVEAGTIDTNLPEIVHPLLEPLYSLFGFYELRMSLVVDELARMRSGRF